MTATSSGCVSGDTYRFRAFDIAEQLLCAIHRQDRGIGRDKHLYHTHTVEHDTRRRFLGKQATQEAVNQLAKPCVQRVVCIAFVRTSEEFLERRRPLAHTRAYIRQHLRDDGRWLDIAIALDAFRQPQFGKRLHGKRLQARVFVVDAAQNAHDRVEFVVICIVMGIHAAQKTHDTLAYADSGVFYALGKHSTIGRASIGFVQNIRAQDCDRRLAHTRARVGDVRKDGAADAAVVQQRHIDRREIAEAT